MRNTHNVYIMLCITHLGLKSILSYPFIILSILFWRYPYLAPHKNLRIELKIYPNKDKILYGL
jgi:hypothetical protein